MINAPDAILAQRVCTDPVSITFEYSFNSALDFPQLVEAVNRVLGTALRPEEGDVVSGVLLGTTVVLERHQLVDDRSLNFSDYQYQLWSKTWDSAALRSIQLETIVLAAFVLYVTLDITDGMLSYETQRLLARYARVAGEWCDTTTGQPVDAAAHMIELQDRVSL